MANATQYTQTITGQAQQVAQHSTEAQRALSQQGITALENLGLPAPKQEDYKYTPLSKLLAKEFSEGFAISGTDSTASVPAIAGLNGFVFNFVNGQLNNAAASLEALRKEATVYSLDEAFEKDAALAAKIGSLATSQSDAFVALNASYTREGLVIDIPKNKQLSQPLILNFHTDTTSSKIAAMPRCYLRVAQGASVSVVESITSQGNSTSFLNSTLEIEVGANASVTLYKLQTESDQAIQVNTTQVVQAADSRFSATTITLGGKMVRNNLKIALDGKNCETHMYGLYMLHGSQHVDNHTVVDHQQPHCESNELYKGIMDDKSTGVFNGRIYVQQIAQKTNAFQSNKNILLSDGATVNTKPQLEIWADDVKCSHGATTGQIDEEQVFYLRSRGLSESSARALLLRAFAADIIEHISLDAVRDHFLNLLDTKLETRFI
jgi:Fe-S cluster assembly protein SufD